MGDKNIIPPFIPFDRGLNYFLNRRHTKEEIGPSRPVLRPVTVICEKKFLSCPANDPIVYNRPYGNFFPSGLGKNSFLAWEKIPIWLFNGPKQRTRWEQPERRGWKGGIGKGSAEAPGEMVTTRKEGLVPSRPVSNLWEKIEVKGGAHAKIVDKTVEVKNILSSPRGEIGFHARDMHV